MLDRDRRTLIFYARRYSAEMGRAVEAVLGVGSLLRPHVAKHLSQDVYLALIEALRAEALARERPS